MKNPKEAAPVHEDKLLFLLLIPHIFLKSFEFMLNEISFYYLILVSRYVSYYYFFFFSSKILVIVLFSFSLKLCENIQLKKFTFSGVLRNSILPPASWYIIFKEYHNCSPRPTWWSYGAIKTLISDEKQKINVTLEVVES